MNDQTSLNQLPNPNTLVKSSLVFYSVMFAVGFEICWWLHKNIATLFQIHGLDWYRIARISVVAVLFLTFGQACLEDFFPSYRRLKATFARVFKGLSLAQVVLLAFISSLGEEILFRGALQPFLGVWLTSLIFAMVHVDPDGKLSIWTVWAFLGGLVMGFAVEATASLWPALIIHFGVNLISISRVSRLVSLNPGGRDEVDLAEGRKP